LAALGLAHLAAASGLSGLAVGIPAVLGAPLGALVGALIKTLLGARGNTAYALMILAGWSATMLIAANTALGSAIGHALTEGQLFLAGWVQLTASLVLALAASFALPWLIPRLIRARLFPRQERANRLPAWRWHLGFDLLVALAMAVGTGTVGLMAAFALAFVPPWLAFRLAPRWSLTLWISVAAGLVAYLLAFALALYLDQPMGPTLVAVLGIGAGLAEFSRWLVPHPWDRSANGEE
jgi:zinc transport system permease protein